MEPLLKKTKLRDMILLKTDHIAICSELQIKKTERAIWKPEFIKVDWRNTEKLNKVKSLLKEALRKPYVNIINWRDTVIKSFRSQFGSCNERTIRWGVRRTKKNEDG